MDTLTSLRASLGVALWGLSRFAEWQPLLLASLFFTVFVAPLLAAARAVRTRHEAAGRPWGAAWLSAALVVGGPLLLLGVLDALYSWAGVASLEQRVLAFVTPVPPGADASALRGLFVHIPATVSVCVVGAFAVSLYFGLYARGGLGIDPRGSEANGLMRLAGLWGNRGPELRFGLWASTLANATFGIALLTLPAALAGHVPPLAWLGAVILTHGWRAAAQAALERPAPEDQQEEQQGAKPPTAAAVPKVEDDVARALDSAAFVARSSERVAAACEKPRVPSPALFEQILAALGAPSLYRHQAKTVEAYFAGEHVALFTPHSSGRKVVRDALAMHAVLAEGASVLYLCRDDAEAERAHQLFRSRSESAHWRWNVPSLVLGGREVLDLDRVQPVILFASWEQVHDRLLAEAHRYRFFLRSLELVAVTHVERYQGPGTDHLIYLFARLRQAVRHAAGPSAQARAGRAQPRLLLLADPVGPDVAKLAEKVAAQRLVLVGEELDGAPVAAARHVWLTRADGSVPTAAEAAQALERLGVPWLAIGLDDQLGRPAPKADPRRVQAVLVRADAPEVGNLPLRLRHYGCEAGTEAPVAMLWLGQPDPLSRLLPGARGGPLVQRLAPPRLVLGGASARVARDHARCAIVEADWPLADLEAVFGAGPVQAALEQVPQVTRESRCEVDVAAGEVRRREYVRGRRATPHGEVTLGVVGEAVAVEDRSTGTVVAHVPSERALAAAFPERVLTHEGRRYRLLPIAEQERREQGVLFSEVEARDVRTVPVRRLELELLPDRRRIQSDAPAGERRAVARRAFAGREFSLTWPRVLIRERIEGFRNIQGGVVADAGLFPEVIDGSHEGRAVVLGFPASSGWTVGPAALHALVHLFRSVLPAVVRAGPDDLDVVDLTYGGDPAVAIVDLHPGGGGYAEAISLEAIRSLATLSLAIVRGCSCRDPRGCPHCVAVPDCRSGFGDLGERTASRMEAERVLCELLDLGLVRAGDAVQYAPSAPTT